MTGKGSYAIINRENSITGSIPKGEDMLTDIEIAQGAKLLPIAERHHDYCYELKRKMEDKGLRVEVDDRSEKTGYKIALLW